MTRRGARFVRFYPSDWRSGCIGMTLEEQGLYVAICAYIYETGKRVPLANAAAAKILMVQVQKYAKVIQSLIAAGKVTTHEDGHTVERAERELLKAQGTAAVDAAGSETSVERRSDQGRQGSPRPHPLEQPPQSPPNQPTVGEAEKTQSFLRATKEPRTNSHTPSARASGNAYWQKALNPQADHGVELLEGGRINLVNGTRAEWLDRFGGDDKALDLALIEAAGHVQPSSTSPLKLQVERKLAQIARLEHGSSKRRQTQQPKSFAEQDATRQRNAWAKRVV